MAHLLQRPPNDSLRLAVARGSLPPDPVMEVQYTSYDTHETISIRDIMLEPASKKMVDTP